MRNTRLVILSALLGLPALAAPPQGTPKQLDTTVWLSAQHLQAEVIRTSNIRQRAVCGTPTAAQCRSLLWRFTRCGRVATAEARVDPEADCNRLLAEEAAIIAGGLPERQVLTPAVANADGVGRTASSLDGNDCVPAPGRTCAVVPAYSRNGHSARGMHTLAFGNTLKNMAFSPLDNVTAEAATHRYLEGVRHMVWTMNGNSVDSCLEYVYEKYFDYSTFEELTAKSAGDPRAVWDTAYNAVDLTSSIGSRDIAGIPLSQRDGTPFDAGIAFPPDQPKNVFFTTPLSNTDTGGMSNITINCIEREAVGFFSVHFNDDAVVAALTAGAPTHDESFAWHRDASLSLALQGVIDEELYELENLRAEYARLLHERRAIEKEYSAWMQAVVYKVGEMVVVDNNPFPDEIVDLDPFLSVVIPVDEAGLGVLAAGGFNTLAYVPPMDFSNIEPLDPDEPGALAAGLTQMADRICLAIDADSEVHGAGAFLLRLASVDNALETVILEAQARGCLEAEMTTACDWSPRLFRQRVTDLFQAERERDFQRCLEYTAGDFARVRNRTFTVNGQPVPNCNLGDYSGSPTDLETYFDCIDAWRQMAIAEIVATQGSVIDPRTGLVRVGNSAADTFSLGTNIAGANLNYGASWSLTGFEQSGGAVDPSVLDAELAGTVTIEGRLFGKGADLVSAAVKMTYEQADVDFSFAGIDVYSDLPEQQFSANQLHPVADSQVRDHTFIQASTVVPVLGIPVTVRGGVSGRTGLDYHATAIKQTAAMNNQLVAGVRPFAGINAFASVSIDLAVIEAGVKGSITIVQIGLPWGAGMHVFLPTGEQDVILQVDTAGDLDLSMLAGRLAVFGEIDFKFYSKSAEKTIFSWPGVHTSTNLYRAHYNVPIEPLFFLGASGGVQP